MRTWVTNTLKEMMFMKEIGNKEGPRDSENVNASFEIKVCFTQNATWQGQIDWIEKRQQQNFRSALEMLKLMDEALSEGTEDEGPVSWEG